MDEQGTDGPTQTQKESILKGGSCDRKCGKIKEALSKHAEMKLRKPKIKWN